MVASSEHHAHAIEGTLRADLDVTDRTRRVDVTGPIERDAATEPPGTDALESGAP